MKSYRGVVEAGGIVLTEAVDLPVGTVVEVRVIDVPRPENWDEMDEAAREAWFERKPLALGIIGNLQTRDPDPEDCEDELEELTSGPLLSEQIIRERR